MRKERIEGQTDILESSRKRRGGITAAASKMKEGIPSVTLTRKSLWDLQLWIKVIQGDGRVI